MTQSAKMPHELVARIVTSKRSVYTYLPDGRSQRFKTATKEMILPQELLVFLPNFQTLMNAAPPSVKGTFGRDQQELEALILSYISMSPSSGMVLIGEEEGRFAKNMQELMELTRPFMLLLRGPSGNRKLKHAFPVSPFPRIGYYAFDCIQIDEKGKRRYSRHLGNDVVEICYKDGRVERAN